MTAFSRTSYSHKDSDKAFSSKITALYLACLHFNADYQHGKLPAPFCCLILAITKV